MPSVGMRRSTRVFGTRVLRSGRKIRRGPVDGGKYGKKINGDNEWIELVDNSGGGSPCKGSIWVENQKENDTTIKRSAEGILETLEYQGAVEATNADRMYGNVYSRKRKRIDSEGTNFSADKKFGKKYVRRRWRNELGPFDQFQMLDSGCSELAIVTAESSGDTGHLISCFLHSALRYLRRVKFGLSWLSALVSSGPLFDAFSLHGIHFLKDTTVFKKPGFCIISESWSFIPVFAVDYSAVPFFFMHLHSSMYLRSAHLACDLVMHPFGANGKVKRVIDYEKELFHDIPSGIDQSNSSILTSEIDVSERRELSHSAGGLSKSAFQNNQLRAGHGIQKRRTSLRRRRGRPPSVFRAQRSRHDGFQSFILPTSHILQSSVKGSSVKSSMMGSTEDKNGNNCSCNILVVERDKCYREEGAIITLEVSSSKHWFLAVKKDGIERFSLNVQEVMRPPSFNRVTHATIWSGDSNWKLEFPSKRDWLVFKELYEKCSDHNAPRPVTSLIPIPGVREVLDPPYTDNNLYSRPDSYITVKDDELARALEKRTANYDMDSEDEEWLNKLNTELNVEKELHQPVVPEKFELIIDALERAFHCKADDRSDEKAADSLPIAFERKEVVDAVHNYWIQKRRRKHSALVRIFQLYQPRRIQAISKSILRKKRSLKRHGSHAGRGKQTPFLQAAAMVAEQDAMEQQNNFIKVQEAKAAASRSEEVAIVKRQRAQMLIENADLVTYKAMMALRIAEAARISESQTDIMQLFP